VHISKFRPGTPRTAMWSSLQPSQLCTAAQIMNMTSSGHTPRPGGDSHAPPANSITFLLQY